MPSSTPLEVVETFDFLLGIAAGVVPWFTTCELDQKVAIDSKANLTRGGGVGMFVGQDTSRRER
ncbi:hypothetical protein Tdes44962_MAKER03096 [Teratosphaeria destructans]|uniref:Uncharacterized protein n=1 Tax=Teratosphaeria destructans TaxID=418781 RepID=A0A9W7SR78_9PEZI|nr:hypothetical protein Tdes44962_MAKER03096 [Teratosphaeria destructans]